MLGEYENNVKVNCMWIKQISKCNFMKKTIRSMHTIAMSASVFNITKHSELSNWVGKGYLVLKAPPKIR